MSRFSDQIRDEYGRTVPGVAIYVYKWDAYAQVAGDLETLTDDLSAPLANPLTSDADGLYYFNSLDGQKLLEFHYGGKDQLRELILVGALPVPEATFAGLFTNAAALTIPVGMDLIVTTGYSSLDVGAAVYTSDAAVNTAYVAANPRTSFISLNNRGFRLSTEQDATLQMFGGLGPTADDTVAVQTAFDWLAPGRTLVMPPEIKITSLVNLGDGTSTTLSTKSNCTIKWGGEVGDIDALIRPVSDTGRAAHAGTRFIWAGVAGGTMMKWNGIMGIRMIGGLVLDGMDFSGAGTGASKCLEAYSFSGVIADSIVAVNWKASGRGILFTTWSATSIGGLTPAVVASKNRIGRLIASSPDASGSECIRLDGYRATGGQDFTVSQIGYVEAGFNGNGGKGLVLGYTDNCEINHGIAILYRAIVGTPYGLYLDGTSVPFEYPAQFFIDKFAISGAVSVGGGTNAQVNVDYFMLDDGATIPTGGVSGLNIGHLVQTGTAIDQMAMPQDGKTKSRALSDFEGYYGLALDGTHQMSATRVGTAAHIAGRGDVEFEAGATGGPTTTKQARVTTNGIDLSSGKFLSVAGTQVVGARNTGWTADTGTAKKTANATYAAGTTLTYSAAYVQAEQTAMATRVAALEVAIQNNSQTIKALKDALIAHGQIGA